jgi:8-oxo-dGTP diphosphatase
LKPTVRVVAAVIYDDQRRVLVTQRPAGKALAGQWEFPGGKLEPGEPERAALGRELHEELGITVAAARPLSTLTHEYPERHVELSVWMVEGYDGVPAGLEGQALHWALPAALRTLPLLPADLPIVGWLEHMERPMELTATHNDTSHNAN